MVLGLGDGHDGGGDFDGGFCDDEGRRGDGLVLRNLLNVVNLYL